MQDLLAKGAIEVGGAGVGDFASHHLRYDAFGCGLGNRFGSDVPAITQDADGVAEAEDFLHAMGDVYDGDAASF